MKIKRYPLIGFPERLNTVMAGEMSDQNWAELLGCERKTILAWRHGSRQPDAVMLGKICKRAGVSADWLLFGKVANDGNTNAK